MTFKTKVNTFFVSGLLQVAVLVNAALGLRTTLSGYNGGCIDIDIDRYRDIS